MNCAVYAGCMHRHFTVSGFVVEGDGTLLHWHKKLRIWLPPGGHIDSAPVARLAGVDPPESVLESL